MVEAAGRRKWGVGIELRAGVRGVPGRWAAMVVWLAVLCGAFGAFGLSYAGYRDVSTRIAVAESEGRRVEFNQRRSARNAVVLMVVSGFVAAGSCGALVVTVVGRRNGGASRPGFPSGS
jgi:hypothetical protein